MSLVAGADVGEQGLEVDFEPQRGSASELWDMHPVLFEGEFPLNREVVEAETNKRSLGSPDLAHAMTGWVAEIDVLEAVRLDVKQIADKARKLARETQR